MTTISIADALLDAFSVNAKDAATPVVFYTNNSYGLGEWSITATLPGNAIEKTVSLVDGVASIVMATEIARLTNELSRLGANVEVKDHGDCTVCNGEVAVTATFPNGVKFDPIDLAERLAAKAGYQA
jgi:hypothetical protein